MPKPNLELIAQVTKLADGSRSSVQIAKMLDRNPRHIRKILLKYDLPRLGEGAQAGELNHQFVAGRRITKSGYVLISVPHDYPSAKLRKGRKSGYMFEHRYVLEQKLGRPLLGSEVVDHVDGLTLHNHPDNLRLFPDNGSHLRQTLAGKVPNWSAAGRQNMFVRHHQPEALVPVDTYRQLEAQGVLRMRQILLAALRLGIDSPYLLGTQRWLEKAGIDVSSRSKIEHALVALCQQWGLAHPL